MRALTDPAVQQLPQLPRGHAAVVAAGEQGARSRQPAQRRDGVLVCWDTDSARPGAREQVEETGGVTHSSETLVRLPSFLVSRSVPVNINRAHDGPDGRRESVASLDQLELVLAQDPLARSRVHAHGGNPHRRARLRRYECDGCHSTLVGARERCNLRRCRHKGDNGKLASEAPNNDGRVHASVPEWHEAVYRGLQLHLLEHCLRGHLEHAHGLVQ
mmetsp:Transcript_23974/g.55669  ORF Transcript_23974/g.55669 Transcript_23974/m.55669 type:complete len:216 (-) Transcript_23974:829-1476(-)